jgi:hypothetical protein
VNDLPTNTIVYPATGKPYVVLDQREPSAAERGAGARGELGLRFRGLPDGRSDWSFLLQYPEAVRFLSIADGTCKDARHIAELPHLEALSLSVDQRVDLDLTPLTRLWYFHGAHRHFESVSEVTSLTHLALQGTIGTALSRIRGPLEYLELIGARTLRELPELDDPTRLKTLWVEGSQDLSLARIGSFAGISSITLQTIGRIVDTAALLQLPSLEAIGLKACRAFDDQNALLRLTAEFVSVIDRNPFDKQFRREAELSRPLWAYYGSARRPPNNEAMGD